MSVASEITRLQNAKASLKTAIEGKGVTVPSSAKLDAYPALVESIQQGGGGEDGKYLYVNLNNAGTTQSNPYVIQLEEEPIFIHVREKEDNTEYFCFELKVNGKRTQVISIADTSMQFYLTMADMLLFPTVTLHKVKTPENYSFNN